MDYFFRVTDYSNFAILDSRYKPETKVIHNILIKRTIKGKLNVWILLW